MAVPDANCIARSPETALGIDIVQLESDAVIVAVALRTVEDRYVTGAYPAYAGQAPALQWLPFPEIETGVDAWPHQPLADIYTLARHECGRHRHPLDLEAVRDQCAPAKMKDGQRRKHDQHPHHHRDDALGPLRLEGLVEFLPPGKYLILFFHSRRSLTVRSGSHGWPLSRRGGAAWSGGAD